MKSIRLPLSDLLAPAPVVSDAYFGEAQSKTEALLYSQGERIPTAQSSGHMDEQASITARHLVPPPQHRIFFYSNKFLVAE